MADARRATASSGASSTTTCSSGPPPRAPTCAGAFASRRSSSARTASASQTDRGRFEAPLVIGAGGHRCPVAKALGEVSEREEVVAAQESETRLPPEWVERLGPLHATRPSSTSSRTSAAMAGTSPSRTSSISASAARAGATAACRAAARRWCQSLRASGRLPADMPIEPFKGHAYVVRRRAPRRLAGPRFMLVGDAAGLARDLSGEGIGPAIRSGILAADAARGIRQARRAARRATCARSRRSTGRGEPGWLGRQLDRLPEPRSRARGARSSSGWGWRGVASSSMGSSA